MDNKTYYVVHPASADVPPPAPRRGKFPLRDLEVGGWLDAPREDERSLRVRASDYGIRHGKRFSVHRCGDSVRCWRIE